MSEEPAVKNCSPLSEEQIVSHIKTQTLLCASFKHGEHEAFKEHVENIPVQQNFDGSLAQGIELVMSKTKTVSDVAPTLIILLQNGAKWRPDDPQRSVTTPYHVICSGTGDHHELLELMIKELGQLLVNAKDDNGYTALMCAVQNANIKCVEILIANGADVNIIKNNEIFPYNPTHMITKLIPYPVSPLIDSINLLQPNSPHSRDTMMGIVDLLLDSGADVDCFSAAAVGNVSCVKKLIQKGLQVNYTNKAGHTLWTVAAKAGRVDLLKYLFEDKGIDKNSIDKHGCSVLYWAVRYRKFEAVRYLLNLGVTITSFVPQACVETCADCGTNIICHYLNGKQLDTDPYMFAIRCNMLDVVRLMNEFGCESGKSTHVLSYAVCENSVDVVEYLLCNNKYPLKYGYADMYDDSRLNSDHQTFLTKACDTQSVEVVKLLPERGTDPNVKVCAKKYPSVIIAAISNRHVEIIARFIRGGVNVNTRSYYPPIGVVLPFEVAVYENHLYAAEILLVAGCSRGEYRLDNSNLLNSNIGCEMQELLKKWNVHKNNVLPLEQRCRMVILNHLSPQADKKITELPLPPQIIRYLSIPQLDGILETFKCNPLSHCYVK